jgi:uncharacterized damage-inducible protein DinB
MAKKIIVLPAKFYEMNIPGQIAKQFRDFNYGGNYTGVNLKDALEEITWEQATQKAEHFNTIAALVFHINYYVSVVIKVLEGGPLAGSDKLSYDVPPINCHEDWDKLLDNTRKDAERFASLVEQFPENKLDDAFANEKYGTWYRNLAGVIEHCHYHLGQIVLIKKMLALAS